MAVIGRDAVEHDGPRRGSFVAVTGGTETAAVIMRGELTAASRREFDREVTRLLEAAPSAVTIDMSDVTYLDVAWIEVLRHLRTRADGEGEATVQVSAASAPAREVLERSGLASEVVMPTSDASAPVWARRATTPVVGAGAVLAASASREPPPVSPEPEATGPARKRWFKGSTELQKLFLAGAAGTVLLVLVALVPSHPRGLTDTSAPGLSQLECTAKYLERDVTGIASDRDDFMRNCEAAGQAILGGQVPLSASTTAPRKTSEVDLTDSTPETTLGRTVATTKPPTSGAATPPNSRARRTAQSTSVPAATMHPAPTTAPLTVAVTTIPTTTPTTTAMTTTAKATTTTKTTAKTPTAKTTTAATRTPTTTTPTTSPAPTGTRKHGKGHENRAVATTEVPPTSLSSEDAPVAQAD